MKKNIFIFIFLVLLSVNSQASSRLNPVSSLLIYKHAENKLETATAKNFIREERAVKLAKKIRKRLVKKAKRKGIETNVEFVDIATLAGAVVCILGVISIIFSPLGGLIVAAIGLLIYLIGKSQGGEINDIIQAIEDDA